MAKPALLTNLQTNIDGFTLRPAAPEDSALLLTLIKELAEYEKMAHDVVATEEGIRSSLFSDHRNAEALIAEFEGAPVGFAIFFHNFSTFLARRGLYLEDLYIKPAMRSRGFGKAILKVLARIAVERGCGRMEWAVLDWNESAIKFYKSLGAEAMDEWTVFRLSGNALKRLGE